MNYPQLKSYIVYNPYTADPQMITDDIITKAQLYITSHTNTEIKEFIQMTYEFAKMAHGDGLRLSGEEYIVHPLLATIFLMSIKPDLNTIAACILHDVIEDTEYTYDDIKNKFNEDVAELCEGMVKVSKLKYRGEERQIETLKKTFFAFSKDLRVIFIKLADRIHNIQTLHYHPNPEKQARIAEETLQIYVPIAKRLGLYEFQSLLENGSFKILHPQEFSQIINYLDNKYIINSKIISEGTKDIEKVLSDHGLEADVKGRIKSPYRIRQKLDSHDRNFEKIYDILAFRVIAKDIGDCYQVLGLLHNQFTPLDKRFKDYIAVPKDNGYKSIHTTVLGLFEFPVEIQIRTPEMEEYADHGVAAHFSYSDNGSKSVRTDARQATWVNKIQEIVENYQEDNEGFRESMNIELLDDNIYIYTPKGEIIELSNGSTILDFAFRVHSNIGLRYRSGTVNGNIVPIDFKLKTGDIVSIQTRKEKFSANRNWLNILHTPSAKNQVNRYLRTFIKDDLILRGKNMLNEKLAEFGLPLIDSKEDKFPQRFTNTNNLENIFTDVAEKRQGAHTLINDIYKTELDRIKQNQAKSLPASGGSDNIGTGLKGGADIDNELEEKKDKKDLQNKNNLTSQVIEKTVEDIYIDGDDKIHYELCQECNPTTQDNILAKSGNNIKIHSTNCKSLHKIEFDKLLPANWKSQNPSIYTIKIDMSMINKAGNLVKIIKILSDFGVNISDISFGKIQGDKSIGYMSIEASNPSKFGFVMHHLEKYDDIVEITSKRFI